MRKRVLPLFERTSYLGKNFLKFCLLYVFSLSSFMIQAQEVPRISVDLRGETLESALWYLQSKTKFIFTYETEDISHITDISVKANNKTIPEILTECLSGTNLTFEISGSSIIIKKRKSKQTTITGWIRDENGEALPGANVIIRGMKKGAIAGMDGRYSLSIPDQEGLLLNYSFIGMETESIKYNGKKTINVTLHSSSKEIDEVVVTGYQNIQRRDLVGSLTTLKADDIILPSVNTIDQMLQGRVAGMIVTNTSSRVGGTPKIKIRGVSTLQGNTDPLWVVDGIIQEDFQVDFSSNDLATKNFEDIIGNQISWLNPADIESITVLKDASATAIYGSKASNGVIEIRTKKNTSDRLSVNYSANFNIGQRPNYGMFNYMNSQDRIRFSQEAFDAGVNYQDVPFKDPNTYEGILRMLQDQDISADEYRSMYNEMERRNTDWFKLLTRRSFSHTHNISVTGGTNKFSYSVSAGYNNSEGQEIGNDNERMTGRIAVMLRPTDKLTINATLNGSVSTTNGFFGEVNPMGYATNTNRIIDPYARYMVRNEYQYKTGKNETLSYNFLNERDNSGSKARSTFFSASLDLNWRILDWLTYQFTGGYSETNGTNESWATEQTTYIANQFRGYDFNSVSPTSPEFKAAQLPFGGILATNNNNQYAYNIQNKIQISKSFNPDNRLNALIGMELRSSTLKGTTNTVWGYVPDRGERVVAPTIPNNVVTPQGQIPGWGILGQIYDGSWSKSNNTNNFLSFFATLAYSYKNRYVLNANIRNDASNVFGQDVNNRLDPTYSFGLSWRASEEEFFKRYIKWITLFNVRATFGIQGNALTRESPELILNQNGVQPGFNQYYSNIHQIPNPYLSWERTRNWNFGVDLELFNKFYMNIEYYTRRSNAVISVELPYEFGIRSMKQNGGIIYNKGIEYTLSFTPIQKKDFTLNVNLNASKNWNEGGQTKIDLNTHAFLNGYQGAILKEGYPLSAFWSYSFAGLDPENGKPLFNLLDVPEEHKDKNIDPTSFLVYSGERDPFFTGGLGLSMRYKSLTLSTSFSLLLGNKKRLPSPYGQFGGNHNLMPSPTSNINKDLLNRWKKPGDEKHTIIPSLPSWAFGIAETLPNLENKDNALMLWEQSDAMVVNGSFLRCRNIGLSWQMKKEWCEKIHAKNLSLNFNMDNIFVIANKRFNGFDPELENSIMPRSFSLGLNVGF